MPRRMVVSPPVSRKIGQFHLPRELLIKLLIRIHGDLADEMEPFRTERVSSDSRLFWFHLLLEHQTTLHAFSLAIDDATSPDHFFSDEHPSRSTRKMSGPLIWVRIW